MNVFKTACAEVLEYLRRAVTPFFTKLMFGMTMLAVLLITNDVLRTILTAVLFAGDIVLTYVLLRSSGETACKMKETGRLLRENKPVGSAEHAGGYKPCKEYAPYKGFVIGAVVSLPAIVLIVVGALTGSGGVRRGLVFSSAQIYESVWNEPSYGADNIVAVHIRHIREKIEINPKEPRYIKVIWGHGYKMEKLG